MTATATAASTASITGLEANAALHTVAVHSVSVRTLPPLTVLLVEQVKPSSEELHMLLAHTRAFVQSVHLHSPATVQVLPPGVVLGDVLDGVVLLGVELGVLDGVVLLGVELGVLDGVVLLGVELGVVGGVLEEPPETVPLCTEAGQ